LPGSQGYTPVSKPVFCINWMQPGPGGIVLLGVTVTPGTGVAVGVAVAPAGVAVRVAVGVAVTVAGPGLHARSRTSSTYMTVRPAIPSLLTAKLTKSVLPLNGVRLKVRSRQAALFKVPYDNTDHGPPELFSSSIF